MCGSLSVTGDRSRPPEMTVGGERRARFSERRSVGVHELWALTALEERLVVRGAWPGSREGLEPHAALGKVHLCAVGQGDVGQRAVVHLKAGAKQSKDCVSTVQTVRFEVMTNRVACETRWMTSLLDDESRFHLSSRAMSLTMASPASVQMA